VTSFRLGIDIGGTFTDIVLLRDDGIAHTKKLLSTPSDYSEAIAAGVRELLAETSVAASDIIEVAHGSTIATNTIIERKGAKVALVTTRGFRDVLELGRFRTARLYDFSARKPEPLVERRLRLEVTERIAADGAILLPVDHDDIATVAATIRAEEITSVAVCFINAYVNPANEIEAAAELARLLPGVAISASTQLLPQIQEYERTSTTVVNAYIRPVVGQYLRSLQHRLERLGITAPVMIMQSSGGAIPAPLAADNPITIIESGPAAGVVGAQRLGEKIGLGDIMVLDVGGTTAKASIIEGHEFAIATETEVGGGAQLGHRLIKGAGYAVQAPTIDIAEVGAGGGSIATVDLAGGIQVGPRSAGAEPGPVCYDRGGAQPTVTDANLVLGYISPSALVGGDLKLNPGKAAAAIAALGEKIGLSLVDTAYGIHLIANSNMMRALAGVSSERGRDPSHYSLFAIGGNGSVHGGKLAEDLRITSVIVPPVAGVFSALGLLFADVEHQVISGYYGQLAELDPAEFSALLRPMLARAHDLLAEGGFSPDRRDISVHAELRYAGQMSSLPVPLAPLPITPHSLAACAADFAAAHHQAYGYASPEERIQIVAVKVLGRGISAAPRVPNRLVRDRENHQQESRRRAYFGPDVGWIETPVVPRPLLGPTPRPGPLIIEEYDSTSIVRPGWAAHLDAWSNIVMNRSA
jgi:N-methylhydantoinase A